MTFYYYEENIATLVVVDSISNVVCSKIKVNINIKLSVKLIFEEHKVDNNNKTSK